MKQSGKLSGKSFTTKSNGQSKTYSVEEKISTKTVEVGEDVYSTYEHITRVAYDENGNRAGTIEPGPTGYSSVLNTNNK